jgi:hypothetical protein
MVLILIIKGSCINILLHSFSPKIHFFRHSPTHFLLQILLGITSTYVAIPQVQTRQNQCMMQKDGFR